MSESTQASISIIASLPTLNLLSEFFIGLVGLFDDLSYYSYHNRNYSKSTSIILELMRNLTLARILMPQIETLLAKAGINFDLTTSDS